MYTYGFPHLLFKGTCDVLKDNHWGLHGGSINSYVFDLIFVMLCHVWIISIILLLLRVNECNFILNIDCFVILLVLHKNNFYTFDILQGLFP